MKTIIIDGIEYNLTPKVLFKKGDFVVIQETTYQITEVKNLNVTLSLNGRECLFDIDVLKNARLWDIAKDAKDGDVLVCRGDIKYSNGIKYERICLFKNLDNAFFTLTKLSNFVEEYDIDVNIDYPDNTVPATKEQKEILFMAMKYAGYTFDFDKKALKKIEQKPAEEYNITGIGSKHAEGKLGEMIKKKLEMEKQNEQKPTWSEEDENRINRLIAYFEDKESFTAEDDIVYANWLRTFKDKLQPKQEWSEADERNASYLCAALDCYYRIREERNNTNGQENLDKAKNWLYNRLKSLRPHSQWKPSEEQMDALGSATENCAYSEYQDCLRELIEQLKKLRGE